MFIKKVSYTNYNGENVTEEFCFNLTKAECLDLDFMYEDQGGLKEYLSTLIKAIQKDPDNAPKRPMYEFLKLMIRSSVGKKSPDGKRFIKNETVANEFLQSEAYVEFLMNLLDTANNPNGIQAFMEGILPVVPEDQKQAAILQLRQEGIVIEK